MNKKRRFEEDEIERIWQQLLDRREDLKARKEIWEAWKEKQKMLKEAPLPFIDVVEDDTPNVIEVTKKEAEEIEAFVEDALSEEDAIEASKPSSVNGFFGRIFKKIKGDGDPLLLRIVMTILMPLLWFFDKIKGR